MKRPSVAIPATAIFTVIGLLAYATGTSKEWILSPVGDWFGDLVPDLKVVVVTAMVVTVIGIIGWTRMQRRRAVVSAHQEVTATMGPRP